MVFPLAMTIRPRSSSHTPGESHLRSIGDDAFLATSDQTKALAQGRPVADQPQKLYLIKGAKYVVLTTKDAGKPRATVA